MRIVSEKTPVRALVLILLPVGVLFIQGGAVASTIIDDLEGDMDCFGTEFVPCEQVRLVDIVQEASEQGVFDVGSGTIPSWGGQQLYQWTHSYEVPECMNILSATLRISTWDLEDGGGCDGRGPEDCDDLLSIDGQEVAGAFDNVVVPDVNSTTPQDPVESVFALAPAFFPDLEDGAVAIVIDTKGPTAVLRDAISIDYSQLVIEYEACEVSVRIDIKPGSYPNCFNVDGNGVVPVAILGSDAFDVTEIDVSTLQFGGMDVRVKGNAAPQCSYEDVSGDFTDPEGAPDGFLDLVCQFTDDESFMWDEDNGSASVTGNLLPEFGGTPIVGVDSICLRP